MNVMNIQPCDKIGLPTTHGPFWDQIFPHFCDYPQVLLWEGSLWSSGIYGLFLELVSFNLVSEIYGLFLELVLYSLIWNQAWSLNGKKNGVYVVLLDQVVRLEVSINYQETSQVRHKNRVQSTQEVYFPVSRGRPSISPSWGVTRRQPWEVITGSFYTS